MEMVVSSKRCDHKTVIVKFLIEFEYYLVNDFFKILLR